MNDESVSRQRVSQHYNFEMLGNVNGVRVCKTNSQGDGEIYTGDGGKCFVTVEARLSKPDDKTLRMILTYHDMESSWEKGKAKADNLTFTANYDIALPQEVKTERVDGTRKTITIKQWIPECVGQRVYYKDYYSAKNKRYGWLPLDVKSYPNENNPQPWLPADSLYVKIDGPGNDLISQGNIGVKGTVAISYIVVTRTRYEAVEIPNTNAGTGSATPPHTGTANRAERINIGLRGIRYNPQSLINGALFNDDANYPEVLENPYEDAAYILECEQQEIKDQSLCVRGARTQENIYPGAILVVDNNITTGSPTTLGHVKRGKVSVFGDFLAGKGTEQKDVEANSLEVRKAVNNIMRTLLADPQYEAPGNLDSRTEIFTSNKEMMFSLKVDSGFAGVGVSVSAKTTNKEQTFVQAHTLEQDYFTVRLSDEWKSNPASLFGDDVTWESLNNILNGRAIAIVTSVTYGRTFSYLKQYSAKKFTYDGSQNVKFNGNEVDSQQSVTDSSSCDKTCIFNMGGTELPQDILKSNKTSAEIESIMAKYMKFSANNQGVVKEFTIQLITGSNVGQTIEPVYYGRYNKIKYTRCPRKVEAHVSVADVKIGAGTVKTQLDVEIFNVVNGLKNTVKTINGNSSDTEQKPWYYTFKKSRTVTFGKLPAGYYIAPKPTLRVRSKITKFRADDSKIIDVSSGKITINLKGDVHAWGSVRIKSVKPS